MYFNQYNGRVDVLSNKNNSLSCNKYDDKISSGNGYDILSRDIGHTEVSLLFFSNDNINALQKGICNMVYNESGGKYNIGRQSEEELKIIMRSVYFNSLKNSHQSVMNQIKNTNIFTTPLNYNKDFVLMQVRYLNKNVLDWCVKEILINIQQFDKYKKDISSLPNPMERPSFVSSAGSKTLEFESFF